ncbi:MAG: NTP transferase domain-containing protein [Gammaproteobacteria bacterium]
MVSNHCVLLAGGLGTRLAAITGGSRPKALAEVGGIPFLHFKLMSLIEMGFTSTDILVGRHGDQIEQFVANRNYPNINIRCFRDGPTLLGTSGAIVSILDKLPATFWVSYADSYVLADIGQANIMFGDEEDSIMVVLHNQDRIETSNVSINLTLDRVIEYVKNSTLGTHEWIDYGLLRFSKSAFSATNPKAPGDLRQVILDQIANVRMRAFPTETLFWDIGTPDHLHETTREFQRRGWI